MCLVRLPIPSGGSETVRHIIEEFEPGLLLDAGRKSIHEVGLFAFVLRRHVEEWYSDPRTFFGVVLAPVE